MSLTISSLLRLVFVANGCLGHGYQSRPITVFHYYGTLLVIIILY